MAKKGEYQTFAKLFKSIGHRSNTSVEIKYSKSESNENRIRAESILSESIIS